MTTICDSWRKCSVLRANLVCFRAPPLITLGFDSMISCGVYVGLVQPGKNITDLIIPVEDENVVTKLARHGEIESQRSTAPEVKDQELASQNALGGTCKSSGRKFPPADIVFKCIDTETAVVMGAVPDTEQKSDSTIDVKKVDTGLAGSGAESADEGVPHAARPSASSREHRNIRTEQGSSSSTAGVTNGEPGMQMASVTAPDSIPVVASDEETSISSSSSDDPCPSALTVGPSRGSNAPGESTLRPQVCVPLIGTGDCGCIGVIGVHGFRSGTVVQDDDWRDWFAARLAPLDRGDSRGAKRVKLVRPRGIPTRGKLGNVPDGTAAKVVYGVIERVSLKRGMPIYAVR